MAKCLITGGAGFIGSHLGERLLQEGHEVVAVDSFTSTYSRSEKESHLEAVRSRAGFRLIEANLLEIDLGRALSGVDYVFHLAGQAGVRTGWGRNFDEYVRNNILATQTLLEAAKNRPLTKLVYASSSSVYGDAESMPTTETTLPKPVSPYGVSKLAAEHLCYLYWKNYAVPAVSVRYFTVYGPRQRPDMAFRRIMAAIAAGRPVQIYGDGEQTRDFTYVSDAVDGTLRAAQAGPAGEVFNLGGGSAVTLNEVLRILEEVAGRPVTVDRFGAQRGDVRHTSADTTRARQFLGYRPVIDLATGLRAEWDWFQRRTLWPTWSNVP